MVNKRTKVSIVVFSFIFIAITTINLNRNVRLSQGVFLQKTRARESRIRSTPIAPANKVGVSIPASGSLGSCVGVEVMDVVGVTVGVPVVVGVGVPTVGVGVNDVGVGVDDVGVGVPVFVGVGVVVVMVKTSSWQACGFWRADGWLSGAVGATGLVCIWYSLNAVKIATAASITVADTINTVTTLFFKKSFIIIISSKAFRPYGLKESEIKLKPIQTGMVNFSADSKVGDPGRNSIFNVKFIRAWFLRSNFRLECPVYSKSSFVEASLRSGTGDRKAHDISRYKFR